MIRHASRRPPREKKPEPWFRSRAFCVRSTRRMLCPIDFSPASAAALARALSIAQEAEAELLLLHVLEWPIGRERRCCRHSTWPNITSTPRGRQRPKLEKMVPPSARDWCTPTAHLVHGKPYEQVGACRRSRGRSHRDRRSWPKCARPDAVRIDHERGDSGGEMPRAHDSAVSGGGEGSVAGGEGIRRTPVRPRGCWRRLAVAVAADDQARVQRVGQVECEADAVAVRVDVGQGPRLSVKCSPRSHAHVHCKVTASAWRPVLAA